MLKPLRSSSVHDLLLPDNVFMDVMESLLEMDRLVRQIHNTDLRQTVEEKLKVKGMCGVPGLLAGIQQSGVPASIHFVSSRKICYEYWFSSTMVPVASPVPAFSMSPASAGRSRLTLSKAN